jgi:hypothetical protein
MKDATPVPAVQMKITFAHHINGEVSIREVVVVVAVMNMTTSVLAIHILRPDMSLEHTQQRERTWNRSGQSMGITDM